MDKKELLDLVGTLPIFVFNTNGEDMIEYSTQDYEDSDKYINLQDLNTYIDLHFENQTVPAITVDTDKG